MFSTSTWGLNHPLAKATFNPATQTHGYITLDVATPNFAYSTNLNDAGVHKLDINNRSDVAFINLTSVGCAGCGPMSISGRNLHGYVQVRLCVRSSQFKSVRSPGSASFDIDHAGRLAGPVVGRAQCYSAGFRSSTLVELDLATDRVVYVHTDVRAGVVA